jgi:hypothetical protein
MAPEPVGTPLASFSCTLAAEDRACSRDLTWSEQFKQSVLYSQIRAMDLLLVLILLLLLCGGGGLYWGFGAGWGLGPIGLLVLVVVVVYLLYGFRGRRGPPL